MYMYMFHTGSEQQVEQPVDFQFAQTELMMNEISSGTCNTIIFIVIVICFSFIRSNLIDR